MKSIIGKNILIFDLETTGLPEFRKGYGKNRYYGYKNNDKYDSSRIVQVSWIYIENYNNGIYKDNDIVDFIRKPEDFFEISNHDIHNITFQKAISEGIIFTDIMDNGLSDAIDNCDYVIGHNVLFDINILLNECYRNNLKNQVVKLVNVLRCDKYICTADVGKNICKIPSPYNNYKFPKLTELYEFVCKKKLHNAHNSKYDVLAVCHILRKI